MTLDKRIRSMEKSIDYELIKPSAKLQDAMVNDYDGPEVEAEFDMYFKNIELAVKRSGIPLRQVLDALPSSFATDVIDGLAMWLEKDEDNDRGG